MPHNDSQEKALAVWVSTQRRQYGLLCKRKHSSMIAERIAALEKIGFEWTIYNNSSWQTKYDELIAFKQQHGHCNVPRRYVQNKPLAYWVITQRTQYRLLCKNEPSNMTSERIAALEKIGFEWNLSLWQTRYDELIAFKQQYDHCKVPYNYSHNKALGVWASTQRRQYRLLRQGKPSLLTAERQAALEKIGFERFLKHDS